LDKEVIIPDHERIGETKQRPGKRKRGGSGGGQDFWGILLEIRAQSRSHTTKTRKKEEKGKGGGKLSRSNKSKEQEKVRDFTKASGCTLLRKINVNHSTTSFMTGGRKVLGGKNLCQVI